MILVRAVTLSIAIWFLGTIAVPIIAQIPNEDESIDVFKGTQEKVSSGRANRKLRLAVTVDSPAFLQVKEGQKISEGDVISDNKLERSRLNKQRSSVVLQISNLKSKPIPKPIEPVKTPLVAPLPVASFKEEEAAIAQAQLKANQAQALLKSRTPMLLADNPQRRAETEKAESAMRQADEKVREQEELLQSMQDMKLQDSVIRHEQAKLKAIQSEAEQAKAQFEREKANLNAAGIEQQQELEKLKVGVQSTQAEFGVAIARLATAQNNRKVLEYKASIEAAQRIEQQNRSQQEWSQQQQSYAAAVRDRDYQLAQLGISLSSIDDKLSQIPVVRSPKDGYIRRIKPWVGNNGRYTTTLTISANVPDQAAGKGKKSSGSTTSDDD